MNNKSFSLPNAITRSTQYALPLSLVLLLATILRFYNLSGQSLWSDEGNSVALARRGFVEIAQRTAFDIHPPLYYWLLKIWITIFGDSETGLRSLSVMLGVVLVYLIWWLGSRLFNRRVGLIAAFIAALSPFQVYYSQEARMYMLLAVLTCLTVLATLVVLKNCALDDLRVAYGVLRNWPASLVYIFVVTAGLYTHYAYPVILVVVNFSVITQLLITNYQLPKSNSKLKTQNSKLINWLLLQLIPLLLYLPWLPTAWRQITTWPSEQQSDTLGAILGTVSTTLLFGLSWPYNFTEFATLILAGILIITGFTFYATCTTPYLFPRLSLLLLWLWFLLPVLLTVTVFSPAFLKFLLVATPPLAILLAISVNQIYVFLMANPKSKTCGEQSRTIQNPKWMGNLAGGTLLAILAGASLLSLYHYYTNPVFARDNYRGIVQFIKAVGHAGDAVILHAEGQQDVFNYYYQQDAASSQPLVYPLPRRRPLDEAETLAELQQIAGNSNKVYGVYWATHQADPTGLIENWLDTHLFKATDRWYGNARLVSYASPQVNLKLTSVEARFGPNIQLTGYGVLNPEIAPGDILQVTLQWQTDEPLPENYTVFLQILDEANHLVGQRDAPPLTPTTDWPVGQAVPDSHGIFIEPGTPPGQHRLIMGLYNSQTGQRLPVSQVDFIELTQIEVNRPAIPLPVEAFNIQNPMNELMNGVHLLGYDFYKLGHRSAPDTPLHSGDPVQLVAYWQAQGQVSQLKGELTIRVVKDCREDTGVSAAYPLAGMNYPVGEWQAGEIVRAQYDFFLGGLEPGIYRLVLALSDLAGTRSEVVTNPFVVE